MECRSCMQIDCEVVELHSNVSEDGKTFYDYFNECTKLNATKSDELPKILCINCAENLQVTYNFISEAIRCDKEFKKLLSRQKVEPESIHSPTGQLGILEEVDPLSVYDSTEYTDIQIIKSSPSDEDLLGINEVDVKTEISVEILLDAPAHHNEDSDDGSFCSSILKCDICISEYQTINDLKEHVSELHKNDVTCTKCSKLFELPRERRLHDKLVHSISECNMHCPWCAYCRYVSRNELIEHVQKNHYTSYLKYIALSSSLNYDDNFKKKRICFGYELAYRNHIKSAHSHSTTDETTIPMPQIEGSNGYSDSGSTSLNTALDESDKGFKLKFKCSECSKRFQIKKSLQRHIRQKHSVLLEQELKFKCSECSKRFQIKKSLQRHIRQKHSVLLEQDAKKEHSSENLVACKYCNQKLSSTKILQHENRHEYKLKKKGKYLCSLCPREFASEASVKVHERRIHLHQRPEPKECPICHKMFDTRYLKAHIANVHHTERKFVCDICGCAYKTKLYLKEHKLLHVERKLPCTLCNKKFVRRAHLKKHMRSHTGEKPFACEVCDKRFTFKGEFNYHMKHHAGIKYKCKDCDKECNSKKQLKIHSYKHTDMPYKCNVCGYGCPIRCVLKKHLLRVHDMTMTPDEYCAMFTANTGRTANVIPLEEMQLEEDHD